MRVFILFIILFFTLVSCDTNNRKKVIMQKWMKEFEPWREDTLLCKKQRAGILDKNLQVLLGERVQDYKIKKEEVISIFGSPDSIYKDSIDNEYIYYITVSCISEEELFEVICFGTFYMDAEDKYLLGIDKLCY